MACGQRLPRNFCDLIFVDLGEEITSGAFWFYINSTFFGDQTQFTVTEQSPEEWIEAADQVLNTFSFLDHGAPQQNAGSQSDQEDPGVN